MIILSISIFASNTEYKTLGYDQYSSFYTGLYGDWNTMTDGEISSVRGIDNRYFKTIPKVAYLSDGKKYIIAYSGSSISLYQWNGLSLTIINGYPIETGTSYIDGDFIVSTINNIPYIIYSTKSALNTKMDIHFLTYNGSFNHSQLNVTASSTYTKYCTDRYSNGVYNEIFSGCPTLISCHETQDVCVTQYQTSATEYAFVTFNDISYINRYKYAFTTSGGADSISLPTIPSLIFDDLTDNDANIDIVTGIYNGWFDGANMQYKPKILSLNLNTTKGLSFDWLANITSISGGTAGGWCRASGVNEKYICSRKVTGVLAMDFDGQTGNGKELFIGAYESVNNYKLFEVSSDGIVIDEHPTTFDIEGVFISNPFQTDCFFDTENTDVGVFAYDTNNNELNLLCSADSNYVGINDDCEYGSYSVNLSTFEGYMFGKSVHSIESDGTKTSELITQLGIFNIDDPEFILGLCAANIEPIYSWIEPNMIVYPVDHDETQRADLIMASDSVLRYLDDGYSNLNAEISQVIFNPCTTIDGDLTQWAFNETARITIRAIDPESNNVRVKAVLYYNTPDAIDSGWSNYSSSGFDIDIEMIPNKIVGIGTIRVYTQDSLHSSYDYQDTYFAVNTGNDSVSFGDCVSIIEYETGVTEDNETGIIEEGTDVNNNAVVNGLRTFSEPMGLSISIIYIIFMVLVAVAIMFADMGDHTGLKFALIGFIEVLMIIIGVKLTIFGIGTMIIMVIGGLVLLIPFIRRIFTGASE
jgi:hypothetical protein